MMGLQNVVNIVNWECPEGCSHNNDTLIYIFFKVYSDCWRENGLWLVIKKLL